MGTVAGKSHQNTHRSVIQPFPNAVKLRNVPIALAVFFLWKLECHVDQRADEAAWAGNSTKHFFRGTLF